MKITKRFITISCALSAVTMNLAACSGGSSGLSNALNVSGTLSLGNNAQGLEKIQSVAKLEDSVSAMSVNLSQYKVSCATTTTPVQTATAAVGSDGSFKVSIDGATGQPLSCVLVDSNGNKAADFLISDTSKKDLNGNSQSSSTTAFKKDADLGTINFDPNAGEVTVPATNISSAVAPVTVAAAQVFDPTGLWTIGPVDFTMPKGTKAPCANGNDHSCNGPPTGQAIYLKLWKGSIVADNSDVFGLQVWQGQNSFATCGSKIGLTPAMKTTLGADFSANGAADGLFSFATSVSNFADPISHATGTVNLTDGWQMDTATLQYDLMPKCSPRDITIGGTIYSNAWVCGTDNNGNYQAQLGGGCTDSLNNPVNLSDWTGIACGATSTDANGIKSMTCTGSASINNQSVAVTCSNKWAVTNGSYVVQPNANFNWSDLNADKIASGTTCSSIANGASSESLKIAQLQCYSQYYYQSGMQDANACLPKVDMDWSATTAANFAIVDKIRPQGLVFFERYAPFADGSGGSLMTRQEHYSGVQVKDSWVNCRVIEVGGLTIKKVSSSKLLATYQSSQITTSLTKPACLAAFSGARESFMFYLTK